MGFEVVDPAFLQQVEHRPEPTVVEAGGIPLIDLSPLLASPIPDDDAATAEIPPALSNLVAEVESSCRDWGFFQVINHGVPSELLARMQSAAKEFFSLPADEKCRVKRTETNPLGYHDTEHTKNVRDWKEVYDFAVSEPPSNTDRVKLRSQWPDYPPDFRPAFEEYGREVEKLAFRLLELIALSLGLPPKRLNRYFEGHGTFARVNHYPACPSPDLALGVGRHRDVSALTVLSQDDVGGLQVQKQDGEWVEVKPISNSYIINLGDVMQVWSNERYLSAVHRVVVNSQRERFSVPLFFSPALSVDVAPLEELVSEETPARYKVFNFGDFLATRSAGNYKNMEVENLQIDHFRIAG